MILLYKTLATLYKWCYNYDELNRLVSRIQKNENDLVFLQEYFDYDAAGNIIVTRPAYARVYDTNNRLTSIGSTAITYDADGNMLTDGSISLQYDSSNKLMSAGVCSYVYNAEGTRISQTHNTDTLWDFGVSTYKWIKSIF